MGNIYKRGKVWYIDVRSKGRRIRKKIGSSKKIAELALKDAEVKIARDEYGFGDNDIIYLPEKIADGRERLTLARNIGTSIMPHAMPSIWPLAATKHRMFYGGLKMEKLTEYPPNWRW